MSEEPDEKVTMPDGSKATAQALVRHAFKLHEEGTSIDEIAEDLPVQLLALQAAKFMFRVTVADTDELASIQPYFIEIGFPISMGNNPQEAVLEYIVHQLRQVADGLENGDPVSVERDKLSALTNLEPCGECPACVAARAAEDQAEAAEAAAIQRAKDIGK